MDRRAYIGLRVRASVVASAYEFTAANSRGDRAGAPKGQAVLSGVSATLRDDPELASLLGV